MKKSNRWILTLFACITMASCQNPTASSSFESLPSSSSASLDLGELIPEVPATCTQEGTKAHYVCAENGKYYNEERQEVSLADLTIPALGHDYGEEIKEVASTCVQQGTAAHYRCRRCGELFTKNGDIYRQVTQEELVLPFGEHQFGELIPEVASTCVAHGTAAHYECSVCGKLFDVDRSEVTMKELELPYGEHDYGEEIAEIPATCEKTGIKAHYQCSVCEHYFVREGDQYIEKTAEELVIPQLEHHYEWVSDLFSHHQKCNICGDETEKEPHQFNESNVCTICGFQLVKMTARGYVDLSTNASKIDVAELANELQAGQTNLADGFEILDAKGAKIANSDGNVSTAYSTTGEQACYLHNPTTNQYYSFSLVVADHLLSTEEDLAQLKWNKASGVAVTGYYVLRKDIVLGGNTFSAEYGWNANSGFKGVLDGAGHRIEHMVVGTGGLFGTLSGIVKNIEFRNFLIGGGWGQALLAHTSYYAALDHVTVSVSDNYVNARDAVYGLLFGNEAQNLTLKSVMLDYLSDIGGFDDNGKMKFGYAIAPKGSLKTVENVTIKTNSSNIMGAGDAENLKASFPGLTISNQL